jgi:hypothetical protein
LLENSKVLEWLRKISKDNFTVICIGGGKQISEAFKKSGFEIKFGPLGRITDSIEERCLALKILKKNQRTVHNLLKENGIDATVIIPVDKIAGVICPVNGDVKILSAYNGYDKIFILTLKERTAKKKLWLKKVAQVFGAIEKGNLSKIEVVGF